MFTYTGAPGPRDPGEGLKWDTQRLSHFVLSIYFCAPRGPPGARCPKRASCGPGGVAKRASRGRVGVVILTTRWPGPRPPPEAGALGRWVWGRPWVRAGQNRPKNRTGPAERGQLAANCEPTCLIVGFCSAFFAQTFFRITRSGHPRDGIESESGSRNCGRVGCQVARVHHRPCFLKVGRRSTKQPPNLHIKIFAFKT